MKKIAVMLLLVAFVASAFACTNENTNPTGTPQATQKPTIEPTPQVSMTPIGLSTVTPLPTDDPFSNTGKEASKKMLPVLISLAYASQFNEYNKDNADFIWCAAAYLASEYGYEVLDTKNPNPTLELSESQLQAIVNAFFGEKQVDIKQLALNTEFFTFENGTYTCVKTFDNDTEFTIEKIKLEGQDHIVSLIEKNSSGKRLTGSVFVLRPCEFESPYPQYVTEMEYRLLGRR